MLVGRADLIAKLKKHPLKRAVRVGQADAGAARSGTRVVPRARVSGRTADDVAAADAVARGDAGASGRGCNPSCSARSAMLTKWRHAPMLSQIGSGALPVDQLPSYGLAMRAVKGKRGSLDRLDAALRALPRPVIGRIADKTLWLDLRCLEESEEAAFAAQLDGRAASMIVGTAGHIDHGKTTLVRALTGVDTDRLKEEKERGISIELGYAYTPLSNGDVLGFIDVPGHERLVHTMVAGACGIDFALLVVAADDGVMPQTREHLAILELLGVSRGAVALSKIDRVD